MQNTKLSSLLETFSKEELKNFSLWLESPLNNSDQKQKILFNVLYLAIVEKHYPEKELVFKKIFPGKKYNEALLRNLISDLLACVEKFLAWTSLNQYSGLENYLLLREYNTRSLPAHFDMRIKQFKKKKAPVSETLFSSSLTDFLIEEEKMLHIFLGNLSTRQKVFKDYDQEENLLSLTRSFLIRYLHHYLVAINTETIFGQKKLIDSSYTESLLVAAEKLFPDEIYLSLHVKLIRQVMRQDKDFVYKEQILKMINTPEFRKLNEADKRNVLTTVVNLFVSSYIKGELEIIPHLAELMDLALAEKSPIRNNIISGPFFTNYVSFSLYVNQEKKAESFIKKYSPILEPGSKEFTVNLALANLAFKKKEFAVAQKHLSQVMPDTPQRFLGVKNLLLKIYFEKNDLEQVNSVIDSIRHKLINDKYFSEKNIRAEKNFLKFYQRLLPYLNKEKKMNAEILQDLKSEMNSTEFIMQKHWLFEKAQSLE